MTDAVTDKKVTICIEAPFVDGATNIFSQRLMFLQHGFKAQTSDDQETMTLSNPSIVEIPHPRKTLAVLQTSTQLTSSLKLWHLRFAQANWQTIKEMDEKGLVKGMMLARSERKLKRSCYNCDMAKMKRMSFRNTSPKRPTLPFRKVYMDLGFIQPQSLEGYTMYLHLIDEGSRFQWFYGQRSKDETVGRLRDFRDLIKAKHQKLVQVFHFDQGTAFMNTEVAKQLAELYSCGLPDMVWDEAASYAIATINQTSTKGNKDNLTPFQKVFGTAPSVRHLLSFGCLALKFVDKVNRASKLSRRGAPTLMVGYASKTKGYRLLDLNTGTISEHRRQNVKFYEQTTVASEYVEKLLDMVYRLRRRPDLDSSKLPFVSLPVSEVPAANDDEASEKAFAPEGLCIGRAQHFSVGNDINGTANANDVE
ncbi:Retrotransposon protein [Phytophthora megakarya]|uniref:Retrotransposon protein n=1 Tax=Phytophthora megakarya TaxID=4795 RepID=A0A225VR34_9STRA|nr:Retrotransposon protein [Phytophthora megakarya]